MNRMFFVNKYHQLNFEFLQHLFPSSYNDLEYKSACYITAVPMIFSKIDDVVHGFESPLDWITDYHSKYMKQFNDESNEEYEERINVNVEYDLTFSMQELGRLGLNLFNGYDHFNLMSCIKTLDEENILVLKTAIDIRLGLFKKHKHE